MYAVERLSSYITSGVYKVSGPFHPFGGAVDIIVVEQQDGSFKSSPWYIRFGKFQGVLKTKEKVVNICVNGMDVGFHMYLDHKGEAYFLEESDDDEGEFSTSPSSSSDEIEQNPSNAKFKKAQSCDYDAGRREVGSPVEIDDGKVMARTTSKRARLLGLMFGRRTMNGHETGGNVEMVSSLERAQIAADLLEMKWSTNLSSKDCTIDKSAEPSDMDSTEVSDNKEGRPLPPSLLDDFNHDGMMDSCAEGSDDNFGTTIISTEYAEEITVHGSGQLKINEGLIGNETRLETDELVGRLKESVPNNESNGYRGGEVINSFGINKLNEHHFEETTFRSAVLRNHEEVLEIHTSKTDELGDKSEIVYDIMMSKTDENDAEDSKRAILMNSTLEPCSRVSPEGVQQVLEVTLGGFGEEEVSSSSYCETVESTTVGFDVSSVEAHETSNSGRGEHFESNVQVFGKTIDLTSALRLQEELGACASVENLVGRHHQNLDISRVEHSSVLENSQANFRSNGASKEANAFNFSMESPVAVADEQKVTEFCSESGVTNQDEVAEDEAVMKKTSIDQMENPKNQSQVNEGSTEAETTCIPLFESVEDDQLQFSENDAFAVREISLESLHDNVSADTEDHPLCNFEGDSAEHELKDDDTEQSSLGLSDVSRTETCPITIPGSNSHFGGTEQVVRSLPNIHSHIHDLETSDLQQPLSCSLNSDCMIYEKDAVKKGHTSSLKLEADSTDQALSDQLTSDTFAKDYSMAEKEALINPAIELSLCKHLLYEGMGSDAAHRAFDAEKMNVEQYSALGPSVVKNDKLVVRIDGHYFPWDAAAPIILGLVSFGKNQILEPQGTIAVDRGEKNLNGDISKTVIPSGGSWRLWPFNLKKSKTISTVRSTPEGTNGKDADSKLIGGSNRQKSNKKMVLTPTSEQLASLNLKEGQNVVTFSFSTAMLGRQQVDARIYLWKWNTRIVISDVDGTITKSDVLGQFMPLVGVDWSQTGVAHLFSAIKDNGYQLLFLSARAISQAYLTRQFLFNLKQDGKALPDGPVVISPDGLFPSLYREVIRRAPHEFKISCLEDIRALFPPDCNPFYAGFGNRDTDELSYLKVGIPIGKIFIINPKGEVAVNRRVDTKSYSSLHALVNGMFPAMSSAEQEDFNSWNYWKLPLRYIDI